MKTYCVYIHKNKINQKVYVGITSQKPERRWGCKGHNYQMQVKFYQAIQKYGWDNFEHLILYSNLNETEAIKLESELIEKYNSIEHGYNVSTGGGVGFKKQIYCITTNQIFNSINEASSFINRSPSCLSHCLHGDQLTCGEIDGIKLEWRFILDSYNKDKQDKNNNRIKQQENQHKQNLIYVNEYINNRLSIREIAKKYNRDKLTISRALRTEGIEVLSSQERRSIPVEVYDKNWNFIKSFNSLTEGLRFIGKKDSEISRLKLACKEQWRIFGGYHWKLKK